MGVPLKTATLTDRRPSQLDKRVPHNVPSEAVVGHNVRSRWTDKPGSVVDGHLSRTNVAVGLKRATRARCGPHHSAPICVCSKRGLPSHPVARMLVVSYTTVSAFLSPARSGQRESSFLRRFPSDYSARPLACFLPCGARTFLMASANASALRSPGSPRVGYCSTRHPRLRPFR